MVDGVGGGGTVVEAVGVNRVYVEGGKKKFGFEKLVEVLMFH